LNWSQHDVNWWSLNLEIACLFQGKFVEFFQQEFSSFSRNFSIGEALEILWTFAKFDESFFGVFGCIFYDEFSILENQTHL
jgi:hypothetical protein